MVSPGAMIAHRTPPQYRTVMVPQTVMVHLPASPMSGSAAICDARARRDGVAWLQLLCARPTRCPTSATETARGKLRVQVRGPAVPRFLFEAYS